MGVISRLRFTENLTFEKSFSQILPNSCQSAFILSFAQSSKRIEAVWQETGYGGGISSRYIRGNPLKRITIWNIRVHFRKEVRQRGGEALGGGREPRGHKGNEATNLQMARNDIKQRPICLLMLMRCSPSSAHRRIGFGPRTNGCCLVSISADYLL